MSTKTSEPGIVAELGVKVGDIFSTSWGYDQTNVDFFQVVGVTKASVKVKAIASRVVSDDGPTTRVVAAPDHFKTSVLLDIYKEGPFTKRVRDGYRGVPSITVGDHSASLWDGKPLYETGSGYGH